MWVKLSEKNSQKVLISSELMQYQILDFPTAPSELPDYISRLVDIISESEAIISSFTLEFLRNTHNLLNGDLNLNVSKGIEQASRYYQAAATGYQDLLDGANKGLFDDEEFNLDELAKFELTWRLEYAKGRFAYAMGMMAFETDLAEGQNQFQLSADFFSRTADLAGARVNYGRLFLSLGCFFQAKGFFLLLQSKATSDPTTALSFCYDCLTHLKKARFVGQLSMDAKIKEVKDRIQELIISRIEKTAEACWNAGMAYSEEKRHQDSLHMLERGSAIFRGLQRLQNREEFVLQEKLLRVSALESYAKMLMEEDSNKEAADKFRRASFALRDVAAYVRAMDKEQLAENFEIQKQFFEGMSTFVEGIVLFDEDDVDSAFNAFKNAEEILKTTHGLAKTSANTILLDQCLDALDQVSSYIETATALRE
jgi:tetratricopeptide (TPR) repeat protein